MTTKFSAFRGSPSEEISKGLWYCKQHNLYWKDGTVYCELSARHNGLIGAGAQLKELCKRT
jgi:hypothetical protein